MTITLVDQKLPLNRNLANDAATLADEAACFCGTWVRSTSQPTQPTSTKPSSAPNQIDARNSGQPGNPQRRAVEPILTIASLIFITLYTVTATRWRLTVAPAAIISRQLFRYQVVPAPAPAPEVAAGPPTQTRVVLEYDHMVLLVIRNLNQMEILEDKRFGEPCGIQMQCAKAYRLPFALSFNLGEKPGWLSLKF